MTKTENNAHRFVTVEEAADILRVYIEFVRNEIKAGNLKAYKIGRAYIIEKPDLESYIKAREVKVGE